MKSTRYLSRLKSYNTVAKRASPGERVLGSLYGGRGSGYPGMWGSNRMEQVMHFRHWVYVYVDTICCKIASIMPNMAAVVGTSKPGMTVKAGQRSLSNLMGRGFGGDPYIGQSLIKTYARPVRPSGDYRDEATWDTVKATHTGGQYVGGDGWNPSATAPVSFSSGGHSFLTMGEWRSKALSVVKPHEELEPLEAGHPLRRLIENPNPVDTFFDIEYELQLFEELCGVSYEWTPKNAFGWPCERWCIPSHWVYPRTGGGQYVPFNVEHADELVWDYEIRPYGYPGYAGVLHFPPDEVIVTRWKSPLSKIDGWSKLTAGAQWIDEEEGISQSRWSQMNNQARAELLIELGPGYEDPDADAIARIEAKFIQRLQGPFNYGKPLIVPPGAKATPMSFSPTEMAYFQSEEQCRDMLGSLWRVPPAAVGLEKGMTYGSIMACLGALCVFCLNPRLAMRGQNRTKHLASQFDETVPAWSQSGQEGRDSGGASYDRHIKLWYDDCVPADPQQVNSDIAEDRAHFAITPNEVRALRGRAPFHRGGDNPIMQGPGGAMPLAINKEENVDEMASIMQQLAAAQKPAEMEQAAAKVDEAGNPQQVEGAPEKPEPQGVPGTEPAGISEPNDGQTLGNKQLAKASAAEQRIMRAIDDYAMQNGPGVSRWLRTTNLPMSLYRDWIKVREGLKQSGLVETRSSDTEVRRANVQPGFYDRIPGLDNKQLSYQREVSKLLAEYKGERPGLSGFLKDEWDSRFKLGSKVKVIDDGGNEWGRGEVTFHDDRTEIHFYDGSGGMFPNRFIQPDKDWDSLEDGGEFPKPKTREELEEEGMEKAAQVRFGCAYIEIGNQFQRDAALEEAAVKLPEYRVTIANPTRLCFARTDNKDVKQQEANRIAQVLAQVVDVKFLKTGVEKTQPLGRIGVRKGLVASGVALLAEDTGRVLMLQRAVEDGDQNSGRWEFPGGKIDTGETARDSAIREWTEEVGFPKNFPPARSAGTWQSANGRYAGFVYAVPTEDSVNLLGRDLTSNPDGDVFTAVAWVDPHHFESHNLRPALLEDVDRVRMAVEDSLHGPPPNPAAKQRRRVAKAGSCKPGETAASTGCTPAEGGGGAAAGQTEPTLDSLPQTADETLAKADEVADAVESKSRQLLAKFKRPAAWLKAKGEKVRADLTQRYGVKGAAAIIGAGQVITWGITIGAPIATGLPIVVPPGGGLATSLALAGLVDLYRKVRGGKVKGDGEELTADEIQEQAVKLVKELIDGVTANQEDGPVSKPANRLKAVQKSPDAVASALRQLTVDIEAGKGDRGASAAVIRNLGQYSASDIKAGAKAAGMTLTGSSKKALLEEIERRLSQRIGAQERTQFRSHKGKK